MKEGRLFSLQNLLTCFIKIVSNVQNLDICNYQSSRLKKRLKLRYPDIVFYLTPDQRKSEFSGNAGGDALCEKNLECFSDDSQMSASQTSTSQASANQTENEENLEPNNS